MSDWCLQEVILGLAEVKPKHQSINPWSGSTRLKQDNFAQPIYRHLESVDLFQPGNIFA